MNGQAGDDGMEPTTDAVEAVQPGEDLTILQRAEKLIDELYQELDSSKENRDFLRQRNEQLEQLVKDLHAWALERAQWSYQEGQVGKKIYERVQALGLYKEQ